MPNMKDADLSDEDMLAGSLYSFEPYDDELADQESWQTKMVTRLHDWVGDICARYGPETFLHRLCGTLRNPEVIDDRLNVISPIIGLGLRQPVLRPLFPKIRVFAAIMSALDRQIARKNGPESDQILLKQICMFIM